ncbi:MAG: sulfotransferase family 2 domain-containing protein [Anaerolineae bacterium]
MQSELLHRAAIDSRPLYFLHIPKTAGLTLRLILENLFGKQAIYPATFRYELPFYPIRNIRDYQLYYGHLDYAFWEPYRDDLSAFSILRNPVQRVLSVYYHAARANADEERRLGNHENVVRIQVIQTLGLENTITSDHPMVLPQIRNGQARRLISHDRDPVNDSLSDDELFERAREHLDQLDFVGLTERFQESLDLLSYTLGWLRIENYETLNAAPAAQIQRQIPQSLLDTIHEYNQADLRLYDYACKRFEQRYQAMMHDLLEKAHNRRLSAQVTPAPKQTLMPRQLYRTGDGWYVPEQDADREVDREWCWMGENACIRFLAYPGKSLLLVVHMGHVIDSSVLTSLEVRLEGRRLDFHVENMKIYVSIPPHPAEVLVITLNSPCAISPLQLGINGDTRSLSLMVTQCELTAID